jgi:hypothetical protein
LTWITRPEEENALDVLIYFKYIAIIKLSQELHEGRKWRGVDRCPFSVHKYSGLGLYILSGGGIITNILKSEEIPGNDVRSEGRGIFRCC